MRKTSLSEQDYAEQSFHGYVIRKLKDPARKEERVISSGEEKAALFSLLWVVYMDRLEHANYDLHPVLSGIEKWIQAIDDMAEKLQLKHPKKADAIRRLNGMNDRLLELLNDNDAQTYEEMYDLSKGMINRFSRIGRALSEAGGDVWNFNYGIGSVTEAMDQVADHIDYLALRHFYSTFEAGKYKSLAALCSGSAFIRSVIACLIAYAGEADGGTLALHDGAASERPFDAEMICSFGGTFDFLKFDDDTNALLPEVVDLLNWDA